jgi:P27 family predicted phage terminase small subunit
MGQRGPAGKPTSLRLLHGDRPSRVNLDEPKPRDLPPEPPDWLSNAAAAEWSRVVPDLLAMGTVTAADSIALGAYCESVARLQAASQLVAKAGLMLRDRDGEVRKNPAVAQARDAGNDVRLWCREFGLTPSARAGIRVEHHIHGDASRLLTHG